MTSSENQINNSITLTLYESQICQNNKSYLPYSLIINYNNNTIQETNIIKTLNHKFNNTKFIFSPLKTSIRNIHQIVISANSKTLFVIKNIIGKVIIRFNISKIEKKKTEWYFLKDKNEEIIMKILLSITSNCALHQYNSMKSLEIINNNILNSSINNISQNINFSNSKLFINHSMVNLNSNSIIHHIRLSSNQLISILENEKDNNGTMCDNSIISNSTFGNSNNTIFYPNSNLLEIIDEKYNVKIDLIKNKILKKKEKLSEIEKKNEDNKIYISSLERTFKKRKNILEKENNKLKENMKKLKKMKIVYENNKISLFEKTRILERKILRDELIEEINNNNYFIFNQITSFLFFNDNLEINLNKKEKEKKTTPIKKNNIIKNLNNIKSRTNSNKKNVNKCNNNNSSIFNLNNSKNLKLNYSFKFLNSSKLNSKCLNENYKSESNLKRNHSSKIKFTNKINLKCLLNNNQSKTKEVKIKNNKSLNKKNKIIKEPKNKIVEFDNIKVITIKTSSSKLNIHSNNIIKKSQINNLSKQKKKNIIIEKKSINKVLSHNHSIIINKKYINNNISNYPNQNSKSINTCIINLQ